MTELVLGPELADAEGRELAEAIGLSYGFDDQPGIRRRRNGTGFSYIAPSGRKVSGPERSRCEELAVPPAWTDVWISQDPDNHILAVGADDAGRRQYRYHPTWREARDLQKYARLGEFAEKLPDIRRAVADDLQQPAHSRSRVVAGVVRLLDCSLIRIGSERYAVDNETFGLTTLERRHVRRSADAHEFRFTAKSGLERRIRIVDPAARDVIDECRALGQPQLLCFRDGDEVVDVTALHVNEYLDEIAGASATAKTFRSWGGTVVALAVLASHLHDDEVDEATGRIEIEAVDAAAEELGNTRAVCRSCYVAPIVLGSLADGRLEPAWRTSRSSRWRSRAESASAKLLA